MFSAEAIEKYGGDNVKIYQSAFTNMYFAMTERKEKTKMKLICVGPEERVSIPGKKNREKKKNNKEEEIHYQRYLWHFHVEKAVNSAVP